LLLYPFTLGDPEIFLIADSIASPVHIVPEWYFLFAYAILRAIPNKTLGVIFLATRLLIFFLFIIISHYFTLYNIFNKLLT